MIGSLVVLASSLPEGMQFVVVLLLVGLVLSIIKKLVKIALLVTFLIVLIFVVRLLMVSMP
jgi:hypothetical protein